ncbi:MAG: hypothetical protein K2J67_03075 [Lachnospiraceae bacterium]|nr:hypothetical protein [Lachnospiraceae bacterium]
MRFYTSRGEGYEGTNILQFVWKRGEGLIGVRDAAHGAGGGGRLFWNEVYLKQEDVGFSIDNDFSFFCHQFRLHKRRKICYSISVQVNMEKSKVLKWAPIRNMEDRKAVEVDGKVFGVRIHDRGTGE